MGNGIGGAIGMGTGGIAIARELTDDRAGCCLERVMGGRDIGAFEGRAAALAEVGPMVDPLVAVDEAAGVGLRKAAASLACWVAATDAWWPSHMTC